MTWALFGWYMLHIHLPMVLITWIPMTLACGNKEILDTNKNVSFDDVMAYSVGAFFASLIWPVSLPAIIVGFFVMKIRTRVVHSLRTKINVNK